MMNNPIISYTFTDVTQEIQDTIKTIVQKNLEGKMDAYLKKITKNKQDAEIRIEYKFAQDKQKKYSCTFIFDFDGLHFMYESKVPFKFPEDLVNHAFKHAKEFLSKQESLSE